MTAKPINRPLGHACLIGICFLILSLAPANAQSQDETQRIIEEANPLGTRVENFDNNGGALIPTLLHIVEV